MSATVLPFSAPQPPAPPAEGAAIKLTYDALWRFCDAERLQTQAWLDVATAENKGASVVQSLTRRMMSFARLQTLLGRIDEDDYLKARIREIAEYEAAKALLTKGEGDE